MLSYEKEEGHSACLKGSQLREAAGDSREERRARRKCAGQAEMGGHLGGAGSRHWLGLDGVARETFAGSGRNVWDWS